MSDQHTKERTEAIVPESLIMIPFDLPEFTIVRQDWQSDGSIQVLVVSRQETAICPQCHTHCAQIHDCRARVKRDLRVREYEVKLLVLKRRFRCRSCAITFTESDVACGRRKRTTARLRETIGKQAAIHPVEQVAHTFGIGPRFARDCFQELARPALEKQGLDLQARRPLPTPKVLGIDEFAVRKGQRYATILCDLEHRDVLEVCLGRTLETVVTLLKRLAHPEHVEAVSMDMSASFAPAVRQALPHAQIVVDHFHVIQHVMKAFRKIVSEWAKKKEGQILLHHKQYLFLTPKERLTAEQQQERRRIASHLPALHEAWKLKEALRTWYAEASWETAEEQLDAWIAQVRETGHEHLRQTLSAFFHWKPEILAFFRFLPTRISNGFVEGKNNRTKALMRQAFGYRNFLNLRTRILIGGELC